MKSPILFIIFKREDTTRQVFERIREARPPKLYIAADGPRSNRPEETKECESTRKVVANVDWPCEVYHLFHNENLGCGRGPFCAITWFFEHEEEGVIIEDDVLPHIDFFNFCDEMLERYRNCCEIKCICGNNAFYKKVDYPYSYYFSQHFMVWGWATWRRSWKEYDFSLESIPRKELIKVVKRLPIIGYKKRIVELYDEIKESKKTADMLDFWDYQMTISILYHKGLNIIPISNLCENIGIGHVNATHTIMHDDVIEEHKTKSCFPIKHPVKVKNSKRLDKITMRNDFGLPYKNIKYYMNAFLCRLVIQTRIKRFINCFNKINV